MMVDDDVPLQRLPCSIDKVAVIRAESRAATDKTEWFTGFAVAYDILALTATGPVGDRQPVVAESGTSSR